MTVFLCLSVVEYLFDVEGKFSKEDETLVNQVSRVISYCPDQETFYKTVATNLRKGEIISVVSSSVNKVASASFCSKVAQKLLKVA